MAAEKDLIVAIELGSSSIRGIIGKKTTDGGIDILNIEQEITSDCIRKGVVYNIDKTIQCLNRIIERLQESQDTYINKVYVGIGGKSLHTAKNSILKNLDDRVIITHEMVEELLKENLSTSYPDSEILDVIPQEYRIGNGFTTEPVGIQSDQIEGNFLNVIARNSVKENLIKCVKGTGRSVAGFYISSLVLAESLLADTEKRSGCALVDFGADTTTVAIFKNNLLRHLAVIPLGGNNITHDIASKQIEFEEAEMLKLKFGLAYAENPDTDCPNKIAISNDRTIIGKELQEIVEARMEEIIINVWEQINNTKYCDKLMAGIIITGCAANIKNLEKAFVHYTNFDKLKCGRIVAAQTKTGSPEEKLLRDGKLNTLLSLFTKGSINCTGIDPTTLDEPENPIVLAGDAKAEDKGLDATKHEPVQLQGIPEPMAVEEDNETAQEEEEKTMKEPKEKKPGWFSSAWSKIKEASKKIVEED